MLYTHKELLNEYKSNYQVKKAVKEEKIFKIEKGIYSNKKNVHYLEVIAKKYPQAIITGESAYYYHNLTDVIPDKICLATKRNAVRIKDKRIKQFFVNDNLFELGKENIIFEGVSITIYNKEKMLIELIKNKKSISFDYYKEVILNYRNIAHDLLQKYEEMGYKNADAIAKVAQDIILLKISKSKFNKNITIKGGVVMHSISNDLRRATRDLDLDFIKYSLEDKSIKNFISKLNSDDVTIDIVSKITELKHQDYSGKRVMIRLKDKFGYEINTKLDIGVHKDFEIEQDEYCFNLDVFNESVNLLINSCEQIFVEKMKSLLKLGYISSRYKDVLDFYYLINNCNMNKGKLESYFKKYIFDDSNMLENNTEDIYNRLQKIFNRTDFKNNFDSIRNNWLELPIEEVTDNILKYMSLFVVTV